MHLFRAKSIVYGETFLRNFKFYAKTLTKLHDLTVFSSVADPDPGSGIRDWGLFDPWIRDPRSGIGLFRIPDPGSRIPDPGSQTQIFESLVTTFWVQKSSIIL